MPEIGDGSLHLVTVEGGLQIAVRQVRASLGEHGRLRLIERALEIGDADRAAGHMQSWAAGLETSLCNTIRERVQLASARLQELVRLEQVHGRFSQLDRSAPEILRYEREMRWKGLPSKFDIA